MSVDFCCEGTGLLFELKVNALIFYGVSGAQYKQRITENIHTSLFDRKMQTEDGKDAFNGP